MRMLAAAAAAVLLGGGAAQAQPSAEVMDFAELGRTAVLAERCGHRSAAWRERADAGLEFVITQKPDGSLRERNDRWAGLGALRMAQRQGEDLARALRSTMCPALPGSVQMRTLDILTRGEDLPR